MTEVVPASTPDLESKPQPVKMTAAEAAKRKAETASRIAAQTADQMDHMRSQLATYGQWGKPRDRDYDGNRNEPSVRGRGWSSTDLNENYLNAYVSGRYGVNVNRKAECWDEFETVSVVAETFDAEAFNHAIAVCDAWEGNHKRYIESKMLPAVATCPIASVAPTAAVVAHSQPQVCVWLTQAVADANRRANAHRSIDSTVAEQRAAPVVLKKMTTAFMNQVYWMYVADPYAESANLAVALLLFAPMKGRWGECNDLLSRAETEIEPDDIFAEFVTYLMSEIVKGKYPDHDGEIEVWIGYQWSKFFFPDFKTAFWLRFNMTTSVNETDPFDDEEEAELKKTMPGELFRCDVDREQANRDIKGWNSPANRVARIFRDMEDPTTEFGQLPEDAKVIIKKLAEGKTKTQVAEELDVTEGAIRDKLKKVKTLRELTFVSRSDVGKGRTANLKQAASNIISIRACADDEVFDISASADLDFEPLLTALEAAQLLRCHEKTVQALARAGTIPCLRFGKYWRFRKSSLDAWVAAQIESTHQSRRVS